MVLPKSLKCRDQRVFSFYISNVRHLVAVAFLAHPDSKEINKAHKI